jgi:signal transduction histidine kinase
LAQSTWFRILVLGLLGLLAVTCLWLLGKLAIYSQAQRIVQWERARIARDIHDDLTARLTQLLLLSEVAQRELPGGSEARQRVGKVCDKARALSRSMNEIIWMVNSQRDTFRDFVAYVCKYAETFLQPTPIRCRFNLADDLPDLPCDLGVRRNLFLAVKEALNNAARHSGATEVVLHIQCQGQEIIVTVEDNGKGFEPALVDAERNGLANMRQRAAEAGGACRLITQSGAGCRVEFAVPLARSSRRRAQVWLRSWKRAVPALPERQPLPAVAPAPAPSFWSTP